VRVAWARVRGVGGRGWRCLCGPCGGGTGQCVRVARGAAVQ
jgi:hypothetical protein